MAKKTQYAIEFPVRCSPSILYEFLSTPAGLQEWFADKVDQRDNIFSFSWNGSEEKADLVDKLQDEFIRFHWKTAPADEFFEFRIQKSEVTNETILTVSDFADKKEVMDQKQLWDYQLKDLFHRIGS